MRNPVVGTGHSERQEVERLSKIIRALILTVVVLAVFGGTTLAAPEEPAAAPAFGIGTGLLALAAAIAVGLGAVGTALAQARIGSAAAGAMAERPEIGGLLIVFLALPETMIILGFLAAFLLIGKIR